MENDTSSSTWPLRACICGVIAAVTVSTISLLGLFDTLDRWLYQQIVGLFPIEPILHRGTVMTIGDLGKGLATDSPTQAPNVPPPVRSSLTIALITAAAFAGVRIAIALRLVPALGVIVVLALGYEVMAFLASLAAHRILDLSAMPVVLMLSYTVTASDSAVQARWRRRYIHKIVSRHVPPDLAEAIWQRRDQVRRGSRLSSQELPATVLFAEMRGFMRRTESRNAGMLMESVRDYRDTMARLIMDHGGMVEGYFGDALKATFGVPFARERSHDIGQDASKAVACALAMGEALQTLNRRWHDREAPEIVMQIGVATGDVTTVCIGDTHSLKFATTGDVVRSAAQLMSDLHASVDPIVSPCSCLILIGGASASLLRGQFRLYPVQSDGLGAAQLSDPVYRVFGKNDRAFFKDTSDPRASSRIPVQMSVTVASEPATAGFTINVSSGGMAVCRLARPLSIGVTAMLQFEVPGRLGPLKTTGTVVWAHQDQAGIAFAGLPPSDQLMWESFLTRQAAAQCRTAA